jgi:hypothetical protein
MDLRLTQLYTLMGTFITRLTVTPLPPSVSARRHVPTASSYEKRIMRPRKVGGSVNGSGRVLLIRNIEGDNTTHTLEQRVTLVLQAVEGDRVGSQEQPASLRTDFPKACCIIHHTASRNQVRKTYFRLARLWLYSLLRGGRAM